MTEPVRPEPVRPEPRAPSSSSSKEREEFTYDPRNERIVIGAAIADAAQRRTLTHTIPPDHMLVPTHGAMWRALRVMVDKGLTYDPETMRRLVVDEGITPDDAYLSGLEAEAGVPENLEWNVSTLRWDATKARVLQNVLPQLLREMKDSKASPESVAAIARSMQRALADGAGRRSIRRKDELKRTYAHEMEVRRERQEVFSFGYASMDARLVEGSMPGKMAIVVGLPGSGKSTFSVNACIKMARKGRRPLYCAWEMGTVSTLDVMIASVTLIELDRIVQGRVTDEEMARILKAKDWLVERITFMDGDAFFGDELRGNNTRGRKTNDHSLDLLEGYLAESASDVVFLDLWERCLVDLSYDGVTQALYRQQKMFESYNMYGVIIHQLKLKDVEKRADKRPTREAIKGTGAFVEVTDQLYGIHREAQFKAVPDNTIEVMCMKQRKGRANWAVRFDWQGEYGRVSGEGVEVPYDPGLESAGVMGNDDLGMIKTSRSRAGGEKIERSRREG